MSVAVVTLLLAVRALTGMKSGLAIKRVLLLPTTSVLVIRILAVAAILPQVDSLHLYCL
jgi:hypothetical protein